mgnify:CR=1 FL=1
MDGRPNKMKATLEELMIGGVTTNQDFCYMILNNTEYVKGDFNTGFIGMKIDSLLEYDDNEWFS